jgi:subtilisin
VLPIFAICNDGPGSSRSPGNYRESLSVGACNHGKCIAEFSSSDTRNQDRGEGLKPYAVPDIVAPGVAIESALPDGEYGMMAGTSMAAPHISGLAALLWEACPAASVDDVEEAIVKSCKRYAGMPTERSEFGMPDAPTALKLLRAI